MGENEQPSPRLKGLGVMVSRSSSPRQETAEIVSNTDIKTMGRA